MLYKSWWSGPVLMSLLLIAFLVVNRETERPSGFPEQEMPFGDQIGSTARFFPGRAPIRSARGAVPSAQWVQGSARVLEELAACLRAAAEYPRRPAPPPGAEIGGEQSPSSYTTDVHGYYRDVCLARIGAQAWRGFTHSYGERPRTWVLQLLASAEDDYDRLRLEPSMSENEAWIEAFRLVPARVLALQRHLLAVYSLASRAEPESGPDGPHDER